MLAVPLVGALACVEPLLRWFGTDARAIPHAAGYVYAMCFGMPAMLVFLAHRYTSEGIGWTRPVIYTAAVGLATNLAGNWLFTLGGLGMPSQGARGCGIATALACWAMLATMHVYQRRHAVYRRFGLFTHFERPDRRALGEILALGIPIAGSVVSEGALFAIAALLMSTLGTVMVAAHQVAISYASLMFMIPLSLHSATTIHVGHQVGRGDVWAGRNAGWSGIAMCGIVMAASSLVILAAREPIAAAYTTDLAVRELAVWLLLFVALFQVPDGLQVGTAGALRGFKDAQRADGAQFRGVLADRVPGRLVVRHPPGLRPHRHLGGPDRRARDLRRLPAPALPPRHARARGVGCLSGSQRKIAGFSGSGRGPGGSAEVGLLGHGAGRDSHGAPTAFVPEGGEPGAPLGRGREPVDSRKAVAERTDGRRHEHFAVVRKPVDGGISSHGAKFNVADGEKPTNGVAIY